MRTDTPACINLGGMVAALALVSGPAATQQANGLADHPRLEFAFDGAISREVLEAYLFRSATVMNMLGAEGRDDQVRMALNIGLKFAGRSFNAWGAEAYHVDLLGRVRPKVEALHTLDPEMILQGTIFEIITTSVNDVAMPAWLLEEFGLPVEVRNFRYEAMLFPDGRAVDLWARGMSVPDITRPETRMWVYLLGRMYVDAGFEAIHVGQIELMGQTDADHAAWADVLNRIRGYAKRNARRHIMLFDGHVPSHGYLYEGDKLLLDFHSLPLRPVHLPGEPERAILKMGHLDTLFGRSKGGVAPSGWRCESLPYLVEVDNFGRSDHEGQAVGDYFVWGYDEICWFARQPEAYRNEWLSYAAGWLRENDPNGFLEMPLARCLAAPAEGQSWFYGNTRAPGMENGFSVEETVKRLWGTVAYDCRDAVLALPDTSRGFTFDAGAVRLNDTGATQATVPPGSLSMRPQEGGVARIRWTAPDEGRYAVAGTVGPADGECVFTSRKGDEALLSLPCHGASRPYRVVVDMAAGESVDVRIEAAPGAAPSGVPVMLVVTGL